MGVSGRWAGFSLAVLALASACADPQRGSIRQVSGQATFEPAELDFGDVALGKEASRKITLRNDGVAELRVDELAVPQAASLSGGGGDFDLAGLPVVLRSGQQVDLSVRFRPSATGDRSRTMAVRTDSETTPELPLPTRGRAVLGLAQISSDLLDFGDVALGREAHLSFTMTNNDGHALTTVIVPGVEGPDFLFQGPGELPLQAEQAAIFDVVFAPQRLGDSDAIIQVVPCPTCRPHPVALHGSGVTRLLAVDPESLDFGEVELGQSVSKGFTVTNLGKHAVSLDGFSRSGSADLLAQLDNGMAAPMTLAPGQRISGTVTYAPRTFGAQSAGLSMPASEGAPGTLAAMGTGVGAALDPRPRALNVGAAVPDTVRTADLQIGNLGLDPSGTHPLVISAITLNASEAVWTLSAPPLPWTIGAPGQSGSLTIGFSPHSAGHTDATLVLDSNDGLHPRVEVPVTALGRILAPCNARIAPGSTVEYGLVTLFRPSTQGFEVINAGGQDCIFGDPKLVQGGPEFSWPGGIAPFGRQLPPGGRMSVRVQFNPAAAQEYSGAVELYLSNPGAPTLHIDLHGKGDDSCFALAPGAVDFGSAQAGCSTADQTAYARNNCSGPVTITSINIPKGNFSLSAPAAQLPLTLAGHTVLPIPMHYTAATVGDDVSTLSVLASTRPQAYRIGLTAGAQPGAIVEDSWVQSTPKVDLLIVIDNSGSMAEEQRALADNVDHLFNRIAIANADYHIAVTTSGMSPYTAGWTQCPGGASGGEGGRFFPVDDSHPRILTQATPDVRNALIANTKVGQCHWDERFLDPVIAALTPPLVNSTKAPGTSWPTDGNAGFLRDDARLALLAFTDTDDAGDVPNPPPVSDYVTQLAAIKHGALDLVSFAGIVPMTACATSEALGLRFSEIARQLGGHLEDICQLDQMGAMLDNSLGSLLAPLSSFPLSAQPADPARIAVTVNGGPDTSWSYDPGTNRIIFPPGHIPPPGSLISAQYESACH